MHTTPEQQISVRELSHQLQKYDPNESIEAVLENPEFQSLLGGIFNALSPQTKAAARKWIQPSESSSGPTKEKSSAALAIIRQTTSTALPVSVRGLFDSCRENPERFWTAFNSQTPSILESTGSITISVSNIYLGLQSLQRRREWDTIVWRYHTLFFYDLALLIGNGQERITTKLLEGLLYVLSTSESITDDVDVIEDNVLAWCAAGHRYWKLCNALDDGALFLLPSSSDGFWENENLLPGSSFDQAIAKLIEIGICQTSHAIKADTLGSNIRSCALDPFRWNLSVIQTVPPGKRTRRTAKIVKKGLTGKNSSRPAYRNRAKKRGFTATQSQQLDLLFKAALYSDQQVASALSVENQRNVEREVPASSDATNNNIPPQAESITESAFPEQTRALGTGAVDGDVFGNTRFSIPNDTSPYGSDLRAESDNTESQLSLEQELDWPIPEEFVHGRPNTGQETAGLEDWPIPEDFVHGRPNTGQENAGLEDWPIPEEFVYGRPDRGQEITGLDGWPTPEEFVHGWPNTGQETVGLEGWPIPEEFVHGRPNTRIEGGWPISENTLQKQIQEGFIPTTDRTNSICIDNY